MTHKHIIRWDRALTLNEAGRPAGEVVELGAIVIESKDGLFVAHIAGLEGTETADDPQSAVHKIMMACFAHFDDKRKTIADVLTAVREEGI